MADEKLPNFNKPSEGELELNRRNREEYLISQQHLRDSREQELNIEMFKVTLSFISDCERIASTGTKISDETLNLKNLLITDLISNRNQNHG